MSKSSCIAIAVVIVSALVCPARAEVPTVLITTHNSVTPIGATEGDALIQNSLKLELFWVNLFRSALYFSDLRITAYEGVLLERQRRQSLGATYGYSLSLEKEQITASELNRLATAAASSMKNNRWQFNSSIAEKYREQASDIYSVVP